MTGVPLEQEFKYYLANQKQLVEKYDGRFIVIKDNRVLGAHDTEMDAIRATVCEHELGTFLVQKCELGDRSYIQTFHSRVVRV